MRLTVCSLSTAGRLTVLLWATAVLCVAEAVPLIANYPCEPVAKVGELQDTGPLAIHGKLCDGATFAPGRDGHGQALRLSGGKARGELSEHVWMDSLVDSFSVSMWLKPDELPAGDAIMLLTKRPGWWSGKPFSLELRNDGNLVLSRFDGGWANQHAGRSVVRPGVWQHVAMTFSAGKDTVLYVDGAEVSRAATPRRLGRNADAFVIGYEGPGDFQGGHCKSFIGLIDDLRFYALPLDAAQVGADRDCTLVTRPARVADRSQRRLDPQAVPPAVAVVPAAGAPLQSSLVFTNPIGATGMWYEAEGTKLGTIKVGEREQPVLVLGGGSAPGVPFARSLRVTVTDPRFKSGALPCVDIEVVCQHPSWSGVDLWADTARGSVKIGGTWGGSNEIRTIRAQLDDAWFAARDFGNSDKDLRSDGFDLRLNAFTGDCNVLSVQVRGYDRKVNPEWKRLLRNPAISADKPVFLFPAAGKVWFDLALSNRAQAPFAGTWKAVIKDRAGSPKFSLTGKTELQAEKTGTARVAFPVDGWRKDVYRVEWTLARPLTVGGNETVLERSIAFALAEGDQPLPKAALGEFLYGLDVINGNATHSPAYLSWLDLMGVDIIRSGANPSEYEDAMPVFRKHRVQVSAMPEARWNPDAVAREQALIDLVASSVSLAKRFPDIRFYELGNEPDLTGFWAGPVEEYHRMTVTVAKAIKQANPNTVIMPGGLSFAGDEGKARSREFIKVFDDTVFDALAFHGHGPWADSEREAFTRVQATAREFGKKPKFFIETESGVAASDKPEQEDMQAATCIQKMVYGQSVGLPLFMWFRLHFEEDRSYGNLYQPQEPRPAVLAYRNMVQLLRGHAWTTEVDLGLPRSAAHLFARRGNALRVLVVWSDETSERSVSLTLGATAAAVRGLRQLDRYGNVEPVARLGASVQVAVTRMPVFLVWEAADPAFVPRLADPPVALDSSPELIPGAAGTLVAMVRNPTDLPFTGSVRLRLDSRTPVTPAESTLPISLAANASAKVSFPVTLGQAVAAVEWPRSWRVFTGVQSIDLAKITTMPESLLGVDGKPVRGRLVALDERNSIDLGKLHGSYAERLTAIALAEVVSHSEQRFNIGASADWWMAWAVDGKSVYDTLGSGNGSGFTILDHSVPIALTKGRHLIAVQVLSGSQGWRLVTAGPEAVELARNGGAGERITLTLLDAAGSEMARSLSPLRQLLPLPVRAPGVDQAPLAELSEADITNLFDKAPDTTKWLQGPKDLGARVWAGKTATGLELLVEVRDDQQRDGDAVQVAWSRDGIALAGHVMVNTRGVKRLAGATVGTTGTVEGDAAVGLSRYRITIPAAGLGAAAISLNVLVDDDDFGARKQYAQLRPGFGEGLAPGRWLRIATGLTTP